MDFKKDLEKGKVAEEIFKNEYINFFHLGFEDLRGYKEYQKAGIDFYVEGLGHVDIKYYNGKGKIFLEETSNVEKKVPGWVYTSKANKFIFVCPETKTIVFLKNDDEFVDWWTEKRGKYFIRTGESKNGDKIWHSYYRKIPLKEFNIGIYKYVEKKII